MTVFGVWMTMRSNVRIGVVVAMAAVIVLAIAASSVRSEISGRDAQALSKASLIYVATVRKDGNQSKAAPVWFTTSADNNAVLIQTGPDTWKAKRIKRGSPVLVWIGSATGRAFIGRAEITSDAAVQNKILDDFRQKYLENPVMGGSPLGAQSVALKRDNATKPGSRDRAVDRCGMTRRPLRPAPAKNERSIGHSLLRHGATSGKRPRHH